MKSLIFFILSVSLPALVFCQCDLSDLTKDLSTQSGRIANSYLEEVNVASTLNRGTLEIKNYAKDEHPYFVKNEWISGSLTYDDIFYPEVPLKYDITKEVLITRNSLGIIYSLRSDKVKNFKLFDRIFINHNYGKEGDSRLLEVKNCGQVSLFLQSNKAYKELIEPPSVRIVYEREETYLLYKDGEFHKLGGRKSILKLLEDQKKALKTFIKEENLYASEGKDNFFSKVTAYYNSMMENQ
ncbi:MAG: hypothetical protein ABJG47_07120 [Ekhidna sp.]